MRALTRLYSEITDPRVSASVEILIVSRNVAVASWKSRLCSKWQFCPPRDPPAVVKCSYASRLERRVRRGPYGFRPGQEQRQCARNTIRLRAFGSSAAPVRG